ncbi:hypothetical protein [Bradyrhizobium sp. BR 10261]|uniref:hypothetical protein n=1 Tax=Bradyrhizobium sp. BR 10261 TaxID=2749992 RepID=UPI001C64EF83|nr:hypothetical protein [Bradyrhizobium sp. BR 10261]MBW7962006.1 S8 family serine peptidase [Bradyrhizobium sp. BR 10261]
MHADDQSASEGRTMTALWQEAICKRPDSYLDWEYRTRKSTGEIWCPVLIQLVPNGDDYLPALGKLESAVDEGRQPEDKVSAGTLTIRMSDDERAVLARRIRSGSPIDSIEAQFFIYRLEPFIYDNGDYRKYDFYETIFAGPPVVGLSFNDRNEVAQPLTFPHPIVTNKTVAIGIVDDGIAFAHDRFRSSRHGSRIAAIWLQETERRRDRDNGVLFGQRLDGQSINDLLAAHDRDDDIYREIGATDFAANQYNALASQVTHGTHVLDLAAGGEHKDQPIFAVQLPSAATIDTSGVTMGSYVLQGVRMIMAWADQFGIDQKAPVPLVINFSYGLSAGPKDGTLLLERTLLALVHHRSKHVAPTRLVVPAGNNYRARLTASMTLASAEAQSLDWVVLPDDKTANFLEIWIDGGSAAPKHCSVEIKLTPPGGFPPVKIRPKANRVSELASEGRPIAGIYYLVTGTGPGTRERILLAINPTVRNDDARDLAPSGRWGISIMNRSRQTLAVHFYVQRDDTPFGYPRRGRQSRLDHPQAYARDTQTGDYRQHAADCPIVYRDTLSSIATSSADGPDHVVVVGAAEATDGYPPADYTSSGPTKLRAGPDCAAIGDEGDAHWGVVAAGTFSGSTALMRGTSVAAPQVVRQLAEQLAASSVTAPQGSPVATADRARLGEVIVPAPQVSPVRRRYPV